MSMLRGCQLLRVVLNPLKYEKDIKKCLTKVDEAYKDLGTQMLVYILRSERRRLQRISGAVESQEDEEVEREGQVDEAIRKLLTENKENQLVAVVLKGDSRQGKTIVADAVYDRVEVELLFDGWKLYQKKLSHDQEFNPNVQELHNDIVSHLTEGKMRKKTFYNAKQIPIIQKDPVFICIDNILRAQDLRKILDNLNLKRPKKLRLLVTSPNTNLENPLKDCGFSSVKVIAIKGSSVGVVKEAGTSEITAEKTHERGEVEEKQFEFPRVEGKEEAGTSEITTEKTDKRGVDEKQIENVITLVRNLSVNKKFVAIILQSRNEELKKCLGDAVFNSCSEFKGVEGGEFSNFQLTAKEFEVNKSKKYRLKKLKTQKQEDASQQKQSHVKKFMPNKLRRQKREDARQQRPSFREIIEKKENVFICADNILPNDVTQNRKMLQKRTRDKGDHNRIRLLVSSTDDKIKSALERCGFECVVYEVDAGRVLNRGSTTINSECGPDLLLQEIVETYRSRCKVPDEEKVAHESLVDTGFSFAFKNAFKNLPAIAQDAFLDICFFFVGWDWVELSLILGEAELQTLEENAWVKRNVDSRVTVPGALLKLGLSSEKRIRITNGNELQTALLSNEMIRQIKGIWLSDTEDISVNIPAEKLEFMADTLRILSLGSSTCVEGKSNRVFPKLRFLHVGRSAQNLSFEFIHLKNLSYLSSDKDIDFDLNRVPPELKVVKLCGDTHIKYQSWIALQGKESMVPHLKDLRLLKLKKNLKIEKFHPNVFRAFNKVSEVSVNSSGLIEVPESLAQLYFLRKLNLQDCKTLKTLPLLFGNLRYLSKVDLSYCSSLRQLPESLGELQSLEELNLSYCSGLKALPASFVWLSKLKKATFSYCHNIHKLPDKFELLHSLEDLDLSFCNSLKLLPSNFEVLSSLTLLNLQGCSKLEKLPDNLPESLLKSKSVAIKLCGCSSLTELQEEFCQGNNIEDLSLAYCTKLEKLPSQTNELRRMRRLNLSGCQNLPKLPESFNELSCLEVLNLSSCLELRDLCDGFNLLKALKYLNISYCPVLKGRSMRTLGKLPSLRLVDFRESDRLESFYSRLRENLCCRRYHFTVISSQNAKHHSVLREKVLNQAATKFVMDKERLIGRDGLLFDLASKISENDTLALIFDHNISRWDWDMLENNVDELLTNLTGMRVIYIGKSFNKIPRKLADRVLAYTPETSKDLSYFDKPLSITADSDFWHFSTYIIKTRVGEGDQGDKKFKEWESISGKLLGRNFKIDKYNSFIKESMPVNETNSAEGSNLKLLEALLKHQEKDYLLAEKGTTEVKISDIAGKMVFLLISSLEISEEQISVFEETYDEMKEEKRDFEIVWVWVPVVNTARDLCLPTYDGLKDRMQWLAIPDPWLMQQSTVTYILREKMGFCEMPILLCLNPVGGISATDVMPMLQTLGSKAWLFINDDSLSKGDSEEMAAIKDQPNLSCLFRQFGAIEIEPSKSQIALLYGGHHDQILMFNESLRRKSEHVNPNMLQILYVGKGCYEHEINNIKEEEALHKKDDAGISWLTLSHGKLKVKKISNRIHYLVYLIASQEEEENEKLESLQRLLLGLLSLDCVSRTEGTMWMMEFDGETNGIFTGRGEELVDLLSSKIDGGQLVEGPLKEITRNEHDTMKRLEDVTWPTVHPSSHLTEKISDIMFCSLCYVGDPAYHCDICECFNICKKCYISEFIVGRKEGVE